MHTASLISFLDEFLNASAIADPSFNGLQVQGTERCARIATAASASLEAIRQAADAGADTLLVHHGLLWRSAPLRVTGPFRERIKALLDADMNLIAYHLPLDAHPQIGNNAVLCALAGLADIRPCPGYEPAFCGNFKVPVSLSALAANLSEKLRAPVRLVGNTDSSRMVESAAVCSGSGSYVLDRNPLFAWQVLLTGDINEQTYHLARESGVSVLVLGHHASEQGGVSALGRELAKRFDLEHVPLEFDLERTAVAYGN